MNDSDEPKDIAKIVAIVKASRPEAIDPQKPIIVEVSTVPTSPDLHPAFSGNRPEEIQLGQPAPVAKIVAALLLLCLLIGLNAHGQASFVVTNDLSAPYAVGFFAWQSDGQNSLSGVTTVAAGVTSTITSAANNNGVVILNTNNSYALLVYFNQMANTNGGKVSALYSTTGAALQSTNNWQPPFNRPGGVTGGSVTSAVPTSVPSPVVVYGGTNGPNGVYTAGIGSIFNLFDGTGTNFIQQYVKTTINGSAGWVANTNFASYAFTTPVLTNSINTPSSVTAASISAPLISSVGFVGAFSGNAAALTNISLPLPSILGAGDSILYTNPFAMWNIPQLLSSNYGLTIVTNGAWPGLDTSGVQGEMLTLYPFAPYTTGKRTFLIFDTGFKNLIQTMTSPSQSNTYLNIAFPAVSNMCLFAKSMGCDFGIIDCPYSPTNIETLFTPTESTRLMFNDGLTNWAAAFGSSFVVRSDAVMPPGSTTNSNGTLNTNVMYIDGIHPASFTNWAAAVYANMQAFVFKKAFPVMTGLSFRNPAVTYSGWMNTNDITDGQIIFGQGIFNVHQIYSLGSMIFSNLNGVQFGLAAALNGGGYIPGGLALGQPNTNNIPTGGIYSTGSIATAGTFNGNGAGITNQASMNWTNIIIGQIYTNQTTHNWALNIPVVFTNAAALGTNVIGLEVWRSGTLGYIVSKAGTITTAATPPGPAWDNLNGFVPPGGAFAVTNLSTLQLTETNNIDYGINVTNMIQIY